MKPGNFSFTHARSVDHVFELLEQHGDEAKIIAGGQSLVPTLNMRLSSPRLLIDISTLDELRGIRREEDRLVVGALTRHVELQESSLVSEQVPLVATAINHVAHAAIRNRGTIGGNLSLADPASELPACSLALDAEFTIANRRGSRRVPAKEYFKDLYETDLQTGDILLSVSFPIAGEHSVHGFREFVRRRGDFASCGLALSGELAEGQFTSLSPVFFALGNTPLLANQCGEQLLNRNLDRDIVKSAAEALGTELDIIGDVHTPAEMKLHLARHFFCEVLSEYHD